MLCHSHNYIQANVLAQLPAACNMTCSKRLIYTGGNTTMTWGQLFRTNNWSETTSDTYHKPTYDLLLGHCNNSAADTGMVTVAVGVWYEPSVASLRPRSTRKMPDRLHWQRLLRMPRHNSHSLQNRVVVGCKTDCTQLEHASRLAREQLLVLPLMLIQP